MTFLDDASDDELDAFAEQVPARASPIATPVFAGANESEIKDALEVGGRDRDGQSMLFDGRRARRSTSASRSA